MNRIGKLAAPPVAVAVAGLLYSWMNIKLNLFVPEFGCACTGGFNTDSLTGLVAAGLLIGGSVACSFASGKLAKGYRAAYLSGCFLFLMLFYSQFMGRNIGQM